MPIRGLPSLDGINELFVGKKLKKLLTKASQTDYNLPTVVFGLPEIFSYMCYRMACFIHDGFNEPFSLLFCKVCIFDYGVCAIF